MSNKENEAQGIEGVEEANKSVKRLLAALTASQNEVERLTAENEKLKKDLLSAEAYVDRLTSPGPYDNKSLL
jgi:cell shape-determining protein MreC